MKRNKVLTGITFSVALASVIAISSVTANDNAEQVPAVGVNAGDTFIMDASIQTEQDVSFLQSSGVKLKRPTVGADITSDDAIAAASKFSPGFAQEAKIITWEYQLLTNNNFAAFSEAAKEKNPRLKEDGLLIDTPVYIVTFKGITKIGHNAYSKLNRAATMLKEYNVVVDANSGEVLYAFSYR